jgi:hypothetical protein
MGEPAGIGLSDQAEGPNVPARHTERKQLSGIALAAIVVGWLLFTAFGVLMTYWAWTEEGLDWYLALGPTIGAAIALVICVVALPIVVREQLKLRRKKTD